MYKNKKIAVIIAAGGSGTRLGYSKPKQFINIGQTPMLVKTTEVFCKSSLIDGICIVTNKEWLNTTKKLFEDKKFEKVIGIISGGKERQDSVAAGLRSLAVTIPDYDYVLIHDGARPYITEKVIENTLEKTITVGAAVAAVPVKDTIRQGGMTLERKEMYAVQTPQGFKRDIIEKAYIKAFSDGYYGTDDGILAERMGVAVAIAEGDYRNIKITTKEDLPMERRIGIGYDVHRLVPNRELILGGVNIPFEKGLLGHSDADVLIHAIMDSILGAAALGDIGRHFPDTDEKYKGISSIELLKQVGNILDHNGFKIGNIDAVVMAQKPKIAPYVETMRKNIANALRIDVTKISIKGTTTEKLGFVGREEGIAAEAVCMIEGEY